MIYLKTDHAAVCIEEALKLIEVEWQGMVFSQEFRETLNLVLDLIEEKKLKYLLVNRKNLQRISLADEEWRQEDWFPRFLQSNIVRSASVISKDYYTEFGVSRLIEEKDNEMKIERRSFREYEAARQWLLQYAYIEIPKQTGQ